MGTTLFINACMRGEKSRTLTLCREYLADKSDVAEVNLNDRGLKPFTGEMIEQRDQAQEERRMDDPMFDLAHQLAAADEVVIGAPFWDLSFPAALKTYFEHVSVFGVTFGYTDEGEAQGYCKAKHITYISTCGGTVMFDEHLGHKYVCGIAKMFGILEVRFVTAENLDIVGVDIEAQLNAAREKIRALD